MRPEVLRDEVEAHRHGLVRLEERGPLVADEGGADGTVLQHVVRRRGIDARTLRQDQRLRDGGVEVVHDEVDRQLHRLALAGVADPDDAGGEGREHRESRRRRRRRRPRPSPAAVRRPRWPRSRRPESPRNAGPTAAYARARSRAASTPLVPRSHTTASVDRASRTCGSSRTAVVAGPSASMLSTTVAPLTQARRGVRRRPVRRRRGRRGPPSARAAVRFQSRTWWPASTRRRHIAAPIRPAPSTATSATGIHQDLAGHLAGRQRAQTLRRRRRRAGRRGRPSRRRGRGA